MTVDIGSVSGSENDLKGEAGHQRVRPWRETWVVKCTNTGGKDALGIFRGAEDQVKSWQQT